MKIYLMGDVHGYLHALIALLHRARLVTLDGAWIGGSARLIFLGDLVDRGPDGIGVIELVMRLQSQAAAAGGEVRCLIGNHEIQLMAAHRFARQDRHFVDAWRRNGGQDSDIARLTPRHLAWLRNLPAMLRINDRLLVHADAPLYLDYAPTLEGVNAAFRAALASPDADDWDDLISDFSQHRAFASPRGGDRVLRDFLRHYGGKQIVHGHTPIPVMADIIMPTEPFVYADGRVVNIDGGMAMGSPGFLWQIQ
jgi:diadenosine tetraphosphatase ApaH/serine/threonine PP2A family protein phosphatase